jgi:hypothetical protein
MKKMLKKKIINIIFDIIINIIIMNLLAKFSMYKEHLHPNEQIPKLS